MLKTRHKSRFSDSTFCSTGDYSESCSRSGAGVKFLGSLSLGSQLPPLLSSWNPARTWALTPNQSFPTGWPWRLVGLMGPHWAEMWILLLHGAACPPRLVTCRRPVAAPSMDPSDPQQSYRTPCARA